MMWYRESQMNVWDTERQENVDLLVIIIRHLGNTGLKGSALKALANQMLESEWGGVKFGTALTCWVDEDEASEMISQGVDAKLNPVKLATNVFDKCFTLVNSESWAQPD